VEGKNVSANHGGESCGLPRLFPSTSRPKENSPQSSNGARILVRSAESKTYLAPENRWCEQSHLARRFPSALDAELFCRAEGLSRMELIIHREKHPPLIIALTLP
jgi:hypothetical protein